MKKLKIPDVLRRNSRSGEGYVDTVVGVLCFCLLLVFIINCFSLLTAKMNMDHYAKELLKTATVEGRTSGTAITNRQTQLRAETGITPNTTTWTAEYFNASQRTVQYGQKIELRITYRTEFKGFGIFSIPVTMTSTHSGLSQRYWK